MTRPDALLRLASRLRARRDTLRKTLADDLGSFRQVSDDRGVGDQVDAAVDTARDEICSQLVEIESRELGQIEQALQRLAAGVYGRCESCGRRIPAARLNALPSTNCCIDCQRERERRGPSRPLEPDSQRWGRIEEQAIEERASAAPFAGGDYEGKLSEIGHQPLDSLFV